MGLQSPQLSANFLIRIFISMVILLLLLILFQYFDQPCLVSYHLPEIFGLDHNTFHLVMLSEELTHLLGALLQF